MKPAAGLAPDSTKNIDNKVTVLLLALVMIEAAAGLGLYGRAPLVGDDIDYHLIASNLVHYRAYSASPTPPLYATAAKTPGYPFFIAAIYALTRDSQIAVRALQFVLLAAGALLIYRIAATLVSHREAIIAAVLYATYLPFVSISLRLLSEGLAIFLTVLMVRLLLLLKSRRPSAIMNFVALGIVLGFAILVRASFALLVFFLAALALVAAVPLHRKMLRAAGFAIPITLLLGPWAVRNTIACRQFVPLTTTSGGGLYASARQYSDPIDPRMMFSRGWLPVAPDSAERLARARAAALRMNRIDPGLATELICDRETAVDGKALFRSLTLRQVARSLPVKVLYFWGPADLGPWLLTAFHRVVQLQYFVLVPFVVTGAWLALKRFHLYWPLWVPIIYLILVHTIYHVEARYSLPARPFLLIFAATPICSTADWLRSRVRNFVHPGLGNAGFS